MVISHRRLTYGMFIVNFLSHNTDYRIINVGVFYQLYLTFKKTHKDNLTVEEVWYTNFLYTDLRKGHNSWTLCRTSQNKCHAHLLFIKFMYINFHLDILTTVVLVLNWKKQRKDDLSPVFAMSPRYLNIDGNTDF